MGEQVFDCDVRTPLSDIPPQRADRLSVLNPIFPAIGHHLGSRPKGVAKDDLLDAAAPAR